MTLHELAYACEVSHTTVLRFLQLIGMDGYNDFKAYDIRLCKSGRLLSGRRWNIFFCSFPLGSIVLYYISDKKIT